MAMLCIRHLELQLHRVDAHIAAFEKSSTSYRMFIISATTPFIPSDLPVLRDGAENVLFEREPLNTKNKVGKCFPPFHVCT